VTVKVCGPGASVTRDGVCPRVTPFSSTRAPGGSLLISTGASVVFASGLRGPPVTEMITAIAIATATMPSAPIQNSLGRRSCGTGERSGSGGGGASTRAASSRGGASRGGGGGGGRGGGRR